MTDINQHIEKLVNMLQSPKPSTRYEACEQLQVSPAITPEAIKALQHALHDPYAEVAKAAERALALHQNKPEREQKKVTEEATTTDDQAWLHRQLEEQTNLLRSIKNSMTFIVVMIILAEIVGALYYFQYIQALQ